MGKIPAFSFERISDEVQEAGHSLQYQSDAADRYAERKGLSIVERFSVTESAYKHGERKEFNRMLTAATASGVKHFIFKSIDRYARNHYDGIKIFELIDQGAAFHFYEMGVVLDQTTEYQQKMFFWFMLANSEGHSAKLSQDITRSHKFKAEKGIAPTAPLGYRYDHSAKRWIIDTEREDMVRWIFDTFDGGRYSVENFVDMINARGYRTAHGGLFKKTTLHQILRNPFYHGEFLFKGDIMPGTQDRYYEKPRYEERVARLSARYYPRKYQHGEKAFFWNNLRCSCGRKPYGDVVKGQYTYYVHKCADAGRQVSVREEAIFAHVEKVMGELAISEEFTYFMQNIVKLVIRKNRNKREGMLAAIEAKERVLLRKRDRIVDLYTDEAIDKEALKGKIADIKQQLEALDRERDSQHFDDEAVTARIVELLDDIHLFPQAYLAPMTEARLSKWLEGPMTIAARETLQIEADFTVDRERWRASEYMEGVKRYERAAIIDRTIDHIVVHPTGELSIEWKRPYSYFFLPEFAEMRRRFEDKQKEEPLLVPLCHVMLPLTDSDRTFLQILIANMALYSRINYAISRNN